MNPWEELNRQVPKNIRRLESGRASQYLRRLRHVLAKSQSIRNRITWTEQEARRKAEAARQSELAA